MASEFNAAEHLVLPPTLIGEIVLFALAERETFERDSNPASQ